MTQDARPSKNRSTPDIATSALILSNAAPPTTDMSYDLSRHLSGLPDIPYSPPFSPSIPHLLLDLLKADLSLEYDLLDFLQLS